VVVLDDLGPGAKLRLGAIAMRVKTNRTPAAFDQARFALEALAV